MDEVWKRCNKCGIENPEELSLCVKCGAALPNRGDRSLTWINAQEIPDNPSPDEIDYDKDGLTYVVVLFIKMKKEWFGLSRGERVKINKENHMRILANYAKLVNRTMLRCEGLSKYDYIELIEADDLKVINSLIRTAKFSPKGQYLDIVESVVSIKGLSLYSPDAADCVPQKKMEEKKA
jgi:hypothetical protein